MILSANTNLFLYAANPDSPHHEAAQRFLEEESSGKQRFLAARFALPLRHRLCHHKREALR
jgi:predicted nucleic acid-binding protein